MFSNNFGKRRRIYMVMIAGLVFAVLLSGCSTVTQVSSTTQTIVQPDLNVIRTEELGNTLLKYSTLITKPSIRTTTSTAFRGIAIPPQLLEPISTDGRHETYVFELSNGVKMSMCFDSTDGVLFLIHPMTGCDSLMKAMSGLAPVTFVQEHWTDINRPQFLQELIYNGKSGNTVKFLYREFSGGLARAPFSQEIQYDLSEGSDIGFKGARLQIIESTNRLIKYRVEKYFAR